MVLKRQCSFCAAEIEPGTGSMYVKRDGTVFHFCSSSCRKQQLHLGRVGHRFKWTRAHALKVTADRASPAKASAPRAPKHRTSGGATPREGTPASPGEALKPAVEAPSPPSPPAAEPVAAKKEPRKPRRRTPRSPEAPAAE